MENGFYQFGCGCVGIVIHSPAIGDPLVSVIEDCGSSSGPRFSAPTSQRILSQNIRNAKRLTSEQLVKLFGRLNLLLDRGERYEQIRHALNV